MTQKELNRHHERAHGINDAPVVFAFLMMVVVLIGAACWAAWFILPVATSMH